MTFEWLLLLVLEAVGWLLVSLRWSGAPQGSRRERLNAQVQSHRSVLLIRRAHARGRCVLCRQDLGDERGLGTCPQCSTTVHLECARELGPGDCPTFGCSGRPISNSLPGVALGPAPPALPASPPRPAAGDWVAGSSRDWLANAALQPPPDEEQVLGPRESPPREPPS